MTDVNETDASLFRNAVRFVKTRRPIHHQLAVGALALITLTGAVIYNPVPQRTIVAFGDSYFSGYGLDPENSFPVQFERALRAKGHKARVINAGVPGETIADGLARLDKTLKTKPDLIILELGANDALRGIDPAITRRALDAILGALAKRNIPVLLCGMLAPRNLGTDYAAAFDPIFPDLAKTYGVVFYPFFLDGVAADPKLNQHDGLHPTAAGVDVIVAKILPKVDELIARAKAPH